VAILIDFPKFSVIAALLPSKNLALHHLAIIAATNLALRRNDKILFSGA
jgi:hypothetical protein